MERRAAAGQVAMCGIRRHVAQQVMIDRLPALVSETGDAESAAAVRALIDVFRPYDAGVYLNPSQWADSLKGRIADMEANLAVVDRLRK